MINLNVYCCAAAGIAVAIILALIWANKKPSVGA